LRKKEIYSISSEGRLGALKSKTGRQGIVREVDDICALEPKGGKSPVWLASVDDRKGGRNDGYPRESGSKIESRIES